MNENDLANNAEEFLFKTSKKEQVKENNKNSKSRNNTTQNSAAVGKMRKSGGAAKQGSAIKSNIPVSSLVENAAGSKDRKKDAENANQVIIEEEIKEQPRKN